MFIALGWKSLVRQGKESGLGHRPIKPISLVARITLKFGRRIRGPEMRFSSRRTQNSDTECIESVSRWNPAGLCSVTSVSALRLSSVTHSKDNPIQPLSPKCLPHITSYRAPPPRRDSSHGGIHPSAELTKIPPAPRFCHEHRRASTSTQQRETQNH